MGGNPIEHGFWYYNWGNVAGAIGLVVSIAGLGFTIWTLRTAMSAQQAAAQARDVANVRSLIDEIRRGELLTRDLASHVSAGSFAVAIVRAGDINELLGWILEFWSEDLQESKQDLFEAKNDVEQASKFLQKGGSSADVDPRDIDKASKRITQAFQTFIRVRAIQEKRRTSDGI